MHKQQQDPYSTPVIRKLLEEISILKQKLAGFPRHRDESQAMSGGKNLARPGPARPVDQLGALPASCGPRPAMPDPQLLRKIIRHRQLRDQVFGSRLFSDPAWDMILELAVAHAEHRRVSVASLSIASGASATTTMRWIGLLEREGIVRRIEDNIDRKSMFIELGDKAAQAIARYFEAVRQ